MGEGLDFKILGLENFQITRTLTHIESQGPPIIIPYPKRLIPLPTLSAPQASGNYRKIVIGKLSLRTQIYVLHHRRFGFCVLRYSHRKSPFCFSYIYLSTFAGIFIDKIAARKHLVFWGATCVEAGEEITYFLGRISNTNSRMFSRQSFSYFIHNGTRRDSGPW